MDNYFCLYKILENKNIDAKQGSNAHNNIGSNDLDNNIKGSYAGDSISAKISIETDDSRLEIIATNLSEGLENQLGLKKFVLRKISKSLLLSEGSIAILPTLFTGQKKTFRFSCYYNLIKEDNGTEYFLCLISPKNEGFQLFKSNLDQFSCTFEKKFFKVIIDNNNTKNNNNIIITNTTTNTTTNATTTNNNNNNKILDIDAIREYLQNWFYISICYIKRITNLIGKDIDIIIHSTLLGRNFRIEIDDTDFEFRTIFIDDLNKFVEVFRLDYESDPEADVVCIEFLKKDSKVIINTNECNGFCKEWANCILGAASDPLIDPLRLRTWINAVKLRMIQEISRVKKLVEEAIYNNYTLYKAYLYIKQSKNIDILLLNLLKSGKNDESEKEIIEIVYKCIENPYIWI